MFLYRLHPFQSFKIGSVLSCGNINMSAADLDPRQCLEGIREACYASNSADEDFADEDADTMKRVSEVETQLSELLTKDESLDLDEVLAEAERAKAMPSPGPQIKPSGHSKHMFPCADTFKALPAHPSEWPQAPLMIRPTPDTSTQIRVIRRARSTEQSVFCGFCAGFLLPINCAR